VSEQAEELPPCPFCGGRLAYTVDADGRPDGLLHSLPTCNRYDDLEIDEFMHQANVARGLHN
jgi:hypothetical protein